MFIIAWIYAYTSSCFLCFFILAIVFLCVPDQIIPQDIIRLPRLFRFLQKPLAQFISVARAPKSKEGYASIGGGSPLRQITDAQACQWPHCSCCKFVRLLPGAGKSINPLTFICCTVETKMTFVLVDLLFMRWTHWLLKMLLGWRVEEGSLCKKCSSKGLCWYALLAPIHWGSNWGGVTWISLSVILVTTVR